MALVRRIPIRYKLAAALAVPLIAMGLVTVIEVASVESEVRDVRQQTALATATIGPNGLITALQNERNWVSANLVGADQDLAMVASGYDETRAATDAARAEFEDELSSLGDAARSAYEQAFDGLAEIDALRTEIDGYVATLTPSLDNIDEVTVIFDRYTALIEPFFGGMSRISIAMDDPELRQGAGLMEAVARQIETIPQLTNALVLPAIVPTAPGDSAGINRSSEIAEVAELQDAFRRQAETLRTASGPYEELAAEYYPEEFTTNIDEQATMGVASGDIDVTAFIASLDVPTLDQAYIGYQQELSDAIETRADELNDAASSRRQRYAILMALTFGAAVVLTVLVSLSITRPLRSLTRQAQDMAGRRLPNAVTEILDTPLGEDVQVPQVSPIRVVTRDEVADVADALNTVQDSALDLAVEQAVLRRNIADSFVNLGRRNQNLLGRQLDFITELESSEADPDTLSSLFRLDHLATRMRRNAESLLVLAGIEPPRQWAAPLPLTDVIRAALGEVEDYQRVVVRAVEPATIIGSAAADLAHLLAELIENALVFSPPDRSVDVRGAANSRRHPDGYTLAIIDAGLGMSSQDIDSANRRLAGTESFTVAPSKYLGHYVAGNLAARHGIDVEIQSSPGSGITALVELPAGLLTPDDGGGGSPFGGASFGRTALSGPAAALAVGRPATPGPPARQLGPPPQRGPVSTGPAPSPSGRRRGHRGWARPARRQRRTWLRRGRRCSRLRFVRPQRRAARLVRPRHRAGADRPDRPARAAPRRGRPSGPPLPARAPRGRPGHPRRGPRARRSPRPSAIATPLPRRWPAASGAPRCPRRRRSASDAVRPTHRRRPRPQRPQRPPDRPDQVVSPVWADQGGQWVGPGRAGHPRPRVRPGSRPGRPPRSTASCRASRPVCSGGSRRPAPSTTAAPTPDAPARVRSTGVPTSAPTCGWAPCPTAV